MSQIIDITGQRFGSWMVIKRGQKKSSRETTWTAQCDCGTVRDIGGHRLRSGYSKSCGCSIYGKPKIGGSTHGRSSTVTYKVWSAMKDRCLNPKHASYSTYGGRGISVCGRWHQFENFLADMGERPEGMSLDRWPDMNGGYEPGNCRWATTSEQNRNKRNVILTFESVVQAILMKLRGTSTKVVAETFGISQSYMRNLVLGNSWPDAKEEAFRIFELEKSK